MSQQQDILDILQQQTQNDWLINYDNLDLLQQTTNFSSKLINFKTTHQITPIIFLIESDSLRFIAIFLAAIITKCPVFLGNPHWQQIESQQAENLLQPNIIWGEKYYIKSLKSSHQPLVKNFKQQNIIGIPTGGSSGKISFAIHTPATLTASVRGFARYFATSSINSCCTLPLYHVSGLMQLWRSLITRGNLAIISYRDLKQGIKPNINPQNYFLSLVPTQLQFLLDNEPDWLSQFKTILLGGAPAWKSLLNRARQAKIPVAITYGMTETASGITYLKPQDFLSGNNSSGKVLPHAKVSIIQQQLGARENNGIGKIKLEADSLSYGYYPQYFALQQPLITDDLGFFDAEGFLHIVGRNSQKIITGGENVYPQEIEAAILATQLVKDVCAIGLEDAKWGQIVIALFIPLHSEVQTVTIQQQLKQQLSRYKQPKHWLRVNFLPRDSKGKINYSELTKMAQELLEKQK